MLENQKDPDATALANFESKHSFISWKSHVFLYGLADHSAMRERLWERSKGLCEGCKPAHKLNPETWQWHHAQKTYGGKRCDGLCCALAVCEDWHQREHRREF